MSARSVKGLYAVLLLLAALLFVSEGAEALWEEMDDSPSDLYEAKSAAYDSESDLIIVFESGGSGDEVYAYDYNTDEWEQLADYPSEL